GELFYESGLSILKDTAGEFREEKLINTRERRGKEFGKIEAMEDVKVHASSKEEKRMSLKPYPISPVPEETARIARAAYPKGNIYLQLRDEFGTIYEDEDFVNLY